VKAELQAIKEGIFLVAKWIVGPVVVKLIVQRLRNLLSLRHLIKDIKARLASDQVIPHLFETTECNSVHHSLPAHARISKCVGF
jgi:hypothetical protein